MKKTIKIFTYDGEKKTETERLETDEEEREREEFEHVEYTTPEYLLLDEMIDELGDVGVDVSYFPPSAKRILLKYSKKITIN